MKILLDTHCWLWWIVSPEKLSSESLRILKNSSNTILFSAASSWEIAIKYAIGKLPLPEPPDQFIPKRLVRDGITPLSIEHSHVLHTARLPHHHRDPFDRLIIAQSMIEKALILTADDVYTKYDVEILKV